MHSSTFHSLSLPFSFSPSPPPSLLSIPPSPHLPPLYPSLPSPPSSLSLPPLTSLLSIPPSPHLPPLYPSLPSPPFLSIHSLSGVFDWILGYENDPINTTFHVKFFRDFAGMSLRGLTWTAPQGYALHHLGFGWQYSLSGSLMGMVYYLGSKTLSTTSEAIFATQQAYSQYYWGWWVWFVLMTSCTAQLVHRIRVWIYRKSPFLGFRPFSRWEKIKYDSLNYTLTLLLYELLLFLLNVVLAISLVFYSLVNEDNERVKGQTFFCLFSSVLFLTFAQGWVWNGLRDHWKRTRSRRRSHPPLDYSGTVQRLGRASIRNVADEGATLLWPYAHPEHSYQGHLVLPEGSPITAASCEEKVVESSEDRHVSRVGAAFLIFWPEMEKWLWMDIFAWIRHLVGFVSLLFTVVTIVFVIVAAILDSGYPRYGGTESTLQ